MENKLANFTGKIIFIGFGSIAKGVLPLFLRHLPLTPDRIRIIAADPDNEEIASRYNIPYHQIRLTESNYRPVLEPLLEKGDFLINLSVFVSSIALIELCREKEVLYIDTSIEPWEGGYTDTSASASARSNYALREAALEFGRKNPGGPTAIVCQGANPGMVSGFLKQALLNVAKDNGIDARPATREDWATLARQLNIRVIHVAERDTQNTSVRKKRNEFVNTWSIDGFIGEGLQPAELGWGTHEKYWPKDAGTHSFGCQAAIYLNQPGAATQVRSWTPMEGPYHGFLITHSESISIADYLTVRENGEVVYRPTVHYAYHPSDDAVLSVHELAGKNWQEQPVKRLMRDEIEEGVDELGVLLMGNPKGVYWYGSHLGIDEARKSAPYNNATSLQVAAGVLAGVIWAIRNPGLGVIEPDDIDHETMLEIARPYLGEVIGSYGEWTPLENRNWPFEEDIDPEDPFQFKNIRVK
ncbi:saccharopine dehydrogenase NADP-binding domain-containing protein [Oxalobacter aliiformigenes]|uniref:Saccharopine dehydrogenase NADP-binding domain-containing protein n=1 Tax=Oxalobacter aliiformigenes TaxID=2946593 RepID=A0ABY7JGU6_9BURK|nr:saccharopine dehydrogenase C-terminal domain-containing protein [Oxalobacter aliiformigenes]WAV92787.1 saccharopine dehydrogenase NADP-binding domain-containing protein [Oxalobacter aliiformigenes]WAV95708.1 saccharopine dehydrogenase NADP-binding domain-containing protein [Oxalobacter aliiformigenes]WAV96498.1 saccharopine dehydrogenase NADP-binding domain-containing protein [Oxalobacter aliiformigenes]